MAEAVAAAGIEKLVSRLREDGVKAGQEQADRIIREAESKAAQIIAEASRKAEQTQAAASENVNALEIAAKGAIKIAARDAMLGLRNEVRESFGRYVRRLVGETLDDPEFIKSMVLILAGEASEKHIKDKAAQIYLSRAILEREQSPEMRQRSSQLVKSLATGLLRSGITLVPTDEIKNGAKVRLVGDQLEIDLSDEMISELLLRHLTPRFREIMRDEK
jgi:V/A-type H+/Na+-transporting ATPase subunit E